MKKFFTGCLVLALTVLSNYSIAQTCTFPNQTVAAANTILNTYYPGTASVTAGATSITVGAGIGSATAIAAGDMVLIIQMQDATQNSANTNAYGDGVAAAPASGFLVATAGTYEYAIAANAVPLAGGTLNLVAGTTNAYVSAAASATQGQSTFQVIRVPRFNNLTINAATSITGTPWNGSAGGVIVLDVNGTLNMNTTGTINANALGFRGGGGRQLGGGGGANTDIRTNATVNNNGAKGEGICGTPRYIRLGAALVNTGVEGYPNGSNGNGAPGNAGGGGTDGDAANNDENTGGGGGGNGGTGGRGGRSWNSNLNVGGYGGVAPAFIATTRVILGGGGGAGTTNDGTGASGGAGLSSSGGAGGGLVILKVNTITNPGTITANGLNGYGVDNDGGGGGGAAGTVYVSATVTASLATLTVNAIGGNGANAWPTVADAGAANDGNPEHGPGGGGGGGVIYSNGALAAASSVAGGTNGITTTSNLAFGATGGTAGVKNQAAAAITLPSLPAPTASSNSPICAGSTLNLTSTPTFAAATYSWTGPNSFASALQNPSIVGATVAATGTYSVSYTLGNCTAGPATTAVTVNPAPTASNAGADASVCGLVATLAGNTPAVGTGAWTQVSGPGTTTFSNAASPTSTATATVAGVYVYQWTITSAGCTASTDQVTITFVAAPTTANAGPDQTICTTGGSATMAGNTPTVGTGVWTQVSGPVTGTITTPASGTTTITGLTTAGTYVFQWTISNAPCTASSDQISVIVNAPPTAANAGPDASVCGLTATLAGNVPATGTGTWTLVAGPGTAAFVNANLATTNVTVSIVGVYTFRWTIANAPCTASQDNVVITFVASPTTANAGPDQTICTTGGSATMAGNTPTVGTGVWTQVSGPVTGTITTPASGTTTITGLTTAGTYVFQWTISNAPCTASSDQISVIVNAPPTAANAGPDASVCGLVATLAGNAPTTGTGTWTQTAGPGTTTFSNANSPTSTATASIVGVYTYTWTIANAPCTASADNVVITFVASPTASNAGPDQTICTTGGTATMAGNNPTVGTGTWTFVSGPTTPTITTPGNRNTTITGMTTAGTYVFQWTIANAPCASSTDQISVIVNAPPTAANAGPDASVCGLVATLAGNAPTTGTGTWTQTAGPGTTTFSNANSPTSTATASIVGVYTYTWTIANAPCTASADNVVITFVASPTTANAGPDQTICTTGGSATMAGNTPTVGTGVWTQVSGPVTGTITTPASGTTTITGLTTAGTYVFQWTISNAPCTASNDQISVIVNAPPTAANAGPDASVCGLVATLAGNAPTTGTGTWTQTAGPGTTTFSNANSPTSTATASIVGVYTYTWTIANAPCTASADNVVITFVASPTASNAGPDQTICTTGGTATMAGNNPAVGTGTWTFVSGPTTPTITTPGNRNTTITGMTTAGTYVFQWTIANAPCASSTDQISVIVNAPPTAANAGPDQTICAVTATMAGNTPATGTGTWTQVSGPNTATITTPGSATSTMTGLISGTYVFQWTITNAPCTASSDQVSITVTTPPTTSNAGPDQTICTTGGSATMAGNTAVVGTGTWTQVSGPVTGTITTPTSPTTTITGLTTAGAYVFQWTITNACGNSFDQITVNVNAPPTAANAGPDASVCGLVATLAGNTPTTGTGTWTQTAGPGTTTFSNANSPTSTATASVVGAYTYTWTIANAPCTATTDNVVITFVASPTASNAGPDQTICTTGGTATMAGNNPTVGTGTWTFVSGPITPTITTPGNRNTTITGMTTAGTYVFQWTIANAPCASSTDQISVIVNAPPTAANAGPDASVCGLVATLAGNAPTTGIGTWTQTAGPGTTTFSNANSPTSTATASIVGVYTYTWTIANAPCTATTDNVVITFVASPTTSNAGPDQTICTTGGTATMAGNNPTVGTGTWTFVSGPTTPTITTPGNRNTTITGMTTAGTYVFQWTIANAPCASSTDQVSIIVNAPPTAANAGPDQTICAVSATMAGNTPATGTGTWTQVSGPNTATITTPGSPTTTTTGLIAGTYVFQWTITNAPCTASSDQVTVTVSTPATTSNAGPDQTICSTGGSATMAGNTPVVGTGAWTQVSGPVTGTITTPTSPTTSITGLTTAGTYVFQWTITNVCGSSIDQVTVLVNAPPTASAAGADASVCGLVATLAGNTPATGTGTWTQISGPGTTTFSNANSATSTATATLVGVYVYQWTIANAPCTATSDQVTITYVAAPTVATAGPDQTICTTTGSATMAGNTATIGTGAWTQVSGPVTGTITSPASPSTTITGLTTSGTYVFQWTISNAPCASTNDQITVIVNDPPTASAAGADASVCGLTATLAGNTAAIGTGTWTQTAGPGTSTFTNANSATSDVTVSVSGVYTFTWTIANAPCASTQDAVVITFVDAPSVAVAGSSQTICSTAGTVTMAGNTPTVGTGVWTQVAGPVTATITTPSSPSTTVTGLTTAGTYTFEWTISNAPCADESDQMFVIVNDPPTPAAAGADASVCGLTATLAGNTATVGTGTWTQTSGPGTSTFTNANVATSDVTVTVTGVYTFTWTTTNAPCASSQDDVTITFVDAPTAALAGADDTVCGLNGTLSANAPVIGTGTWTAIAGPGTVSFANANSETTSFTVTAGGTYTLVWSIANAPCPASTDTVLFTLDAIPTTAAAGPDQNGVCPPTVTMAGNVALSGTGLWTQVSGPNTANILTPNSESTVIGALVPGTYVFVWTISNGTCAPTTDTVSVTVIGCDNDGDGVPDLTDLDDDNDGIPDTFEASGDTDGDGVPDSLDLDSDNDGIPDVIEAGGIDVDGDGIIDGFTDVDGDGLSDNVDPDQGGTPLLNPDTDGDGINDVIDLDSDNDGIVDVVEAGGTDANGDGIIDGYVDTDGDGFTDTVDSTTGGTSLPTPDTDNDGLADYIDIDADNDGIVDNIEAQTTAGYVPPTGNDTDGDGIDDAYDTDNGGTPIVLANTDGTDSPDYLDLDSDNDGMGDLLEGWDTNNDGVADTTPSGNDSDGDGLDDAFDVDGTSTTNAGGSTNGGTVPTGFPDLDNAGGDRDWREPIDHDGDGIPDVNDLDDDNDGIPDTFEASGDTDGDGIPDSLDLDSDNDGIPDVTEAGGTDLDGDGIIDGFTDVDGDGLSDNVDPDQGGTPLPNPDTDGDGVNDVVDLDSDNDGITDVTEAGGTDTNGDGIIDGYTDTDGDGLSDNVDPNNGGTPLPTPDTDGDGINDMLDLDSDNDGITDVTEAGGVDANGDGIIDGYVDTDGDGLSDNVDTNNGGTMLPTPDTDGDGINDMLDLDSDNDGITDVVEAGGTDANGDGIIDGYSDTDGDGLSDNVDTNNGGVMLPIPDTDSDGHVDYLDIDADNDGIVDNIEAQTTAGYVPPTGNDTDGDGIDDAYDTDNGGTPIVLTNTDGADNPDYLDLDSDNDGFGDLLEGWDTDNDNIADTTPSGNDSDGDGLDDAFDVDGTSTTNAGGSTNGGSVPTGFPDLDNVGGDRDWRESIDTDGDGIPNDTDLDDDNDGIPDTFEASGDTDGDGIPDSLDLDSDNDGIPDVIEAGGIDVDGDGIIDGFTDVDGDGLSDNVDPDQGGTPLLNPDTDGDGVNDVVDLDSDNDGITDVTEAGGTDANGDGIIDGYVDTDGDGFTDTVDSTTGGTALPTPDTDGDGIIDMLDLDSDNDGITDVTEAGGIDANGDGIIDNYTDTDGDGLSDNVDTNNGGTMLPTPDTDGDGHNDMLDLDSDNDGITDVVEAGGTDANGDGIIDGYVDTDNDGLSDNVDTNNGGTMLPTPDSDNDGNDDYLDIDADNDGIVDNIEAQTTAGYIPPTGLDTDGDGIDNAYDSDNGGTPIVLANTDGADNPDYLDLDSDNDGMTDLLEGWDTNNDGVADTVPSGNDSDGDGLDDAFDVDGTSTTNAGGSTNGGSVPTGFPDLDNVGGDRDWRDPIDHDNDGIPDNTDLDDDNDGILDTVETTADTDGDGIPNSLDLDSDNDGIPDIIEVGGPDADHDGLVDNFVDNNNDGYDDNIAANPLPNLDSDGDGVPNALDLDSDNDGILDVIEGGGTDANGDGLVDNYTDTNGNGYSDNCDPNAGGTPLPTDDTDGDSHPNFLDIDADNDGIVDNVEGQSTGGYTPPTGNDTDGDGIDDAYDIDNGGTPIDPVNTDGTDNPDYLDLDSDNDGDSDAIEGWDFNNDGDPDVSPSGLDSDGDGLDDAYDVDGSSATNNGGATNGGMTPNSFPDADNVGGDRDWREVQDPIVFVPTGFSPNGDDVNDFFEIVGIGGYPDNHVTIFNRWGNLVFEANGYNNTTVRWDGENTGSLSNGDGPVPEGTYFYIIDLGNGSEVLSGYVFLNRK